MFSVLCRLSLGVLFVTPAWAADETVDMSIKETLIKGDRVISEQFDKVAESIDEFLAGGKLTKTRNQTRVSIENQLFTEEGGYSQNTVDLKVDLHLPNVEEYWELKFATYDENEELRDTRNRYVRRTPRERNIGTSVAVSKSIGRIRTRFQPRVQLEDPLFISHLLRFETGFDTSNFNFNPKLELFARPEKGTGVFLGLNLDRKLAERLTLTFVNSGEYQDFLNLLTVANGLALSKRLNDKMTAGTALIFDSSNRPNYHLDSFNYSISFNHRLFKNVLHYHLVPHLQFEKLNSFKGTAGFIFKTSLIF